MLFVTLGMFIIDEFEYLDDDGKPLNPQPRQIEPQIGGGGTYAAVGARFWIPADEIGMIVDKGLDFPAAMEAQLATYGEDMWFYRAQPQGTTRAINSYQGDHRGFNYLTPRVRLTPRDLIDTRLDRPKTLHFICSPSRAIAIMDEVQEIPDWKPIVLYEPIPDRCIPEELDSLVQVLPRIDILSPNAEEALSLLAMPLPPSKERIEQAASKFLELGVGPAGSGSVIIRSGEMGAYALKRNSPGQWIPAYWTAQDLDKIVDVTGAGNSFLGGFAAGLILTGGDIYEATRYGSVSSSFIIQQEGLPLISVDNMWNGDIPIRRLEELRARTRDVRVN